METRETPASPLPSAPPRYLIIGLLRALYWFDEALQSHMKANGHLQFTRTQAMLLINIASGEHRASRIARNLGASPQAISQMLKEMQRIGVLHVTTDGADKRARLVRFSPQFRPVEEAGKHILDMLEGELESRIGTAGVGALRAALDADWGQPPAAPSIPDESTRAQAVKHRVRKVTMITGPGA